MAPVSTQTGSTKVRLSSVLGCNPAALLYGALIAHGTTLKPQSHFGVNPEAYSHPNPPTHPTWGDLGLICRARSAGKGKHFLPAHPVTRGCSEQNMLQNI